MWMLRAALSVLVWTTVMQLWPHYGHPQLPCVYPRVGDAAAASGALLPAHAASEEEKCRKCGQPKEETAMPAIAMHGSSLPAYAHYFLRGQELPGLKMNYQIPGNSSIQQPLLPRFDWSFGRVAKYGLQPMPIWPFDVESNTGYPHSASVPVVREGWRDGDWMCKCGFHNYSSRTK